MYRQSRGWRHDYRSHTPTMKPPAAENDWVNDSKLLRKWFADRIAWLDKEWA